jgi:Uma2 family endonuclease
VSAVPKTRPLQAGDHLTVMEFERRYQAMPHVKKAELIDGVVYMPSPATDEDHGVPHFNLITWLGAYHVFTPGTQGGDNSTLRLQLGAHMPQPDAYLRILAEYGGQARVGSDGYIVGAPDLVAEVAASSASYDLHEKLRAYQQNAVREYPVWRTQDRAIDWFIRRGGKFKQLGTDADGLMKSKALPGLWLDAQALITSAMVRVYEVGQLGLASEEHRRFVEKLRKRKRVYLEPEKKREQDL